MFSLVNKYLGSALECFLVYNAVFVILFKFYISGEFGPSILLVDRECKVIRAATCNPWPSHYQVLPHFWLLTWTWRGLWWGADLSFIVLFEMWADRTVCRSVRSLSGPSAWQNICSLTAHFSGLVTVFPGSNCFWKLNEKWERYEQENCDNLTNYKDSSLVLPSRRTVRAKTNS